MAENDHLPEVSLTVSDQGDIVAGEPLPQAPEPPVEEEKEEDGLLDIDRLKLWAAAHKRQHMAVVEPPPEMDGNYLCVDDDGELTGGACSGEFPVGNHLMDECESVDWQPDPDSDDPTAGRLVRSDPSSGWLLWESDCWESDTWRRLRDGDDEDDEDGDE
jgi:hypothetical protein